MRSRFIGLLASIAAVASLLGAPPEASAQDASPEIKVDKQDLPMGPTRPGDVLGYAIEIRNVGGGPAFDVRLKDDASPDTTLVAGSVVAPLGVIVSGGMDGDLSVTVDFGTLGPGAGRTVSFEVRVDDGGSACIESVANQATVSGSNFASVVSDDPDTQGDPDPTVTPLRTPFEDCMSDLMQCEESSEVLEGERNGCFEDLDACVGELGLCSQTLVSCTADLDGCEEANRSLSGRVQSLERYIQVLQQRLQQCDEPLPDEFDADADGVGDVVDHCLGTAAEAQVDRDGCSREQFCAAIDVRRNAAACNLADWMNDEPVSAKDCIARKGACHAR